MTPEEQIIAIAEACGWTNIAYQGVDGLPNKTYLAGKPPANHEDALMGDVWPLPDYLNDLNAMHEAEETLCANSQLAADYSVYLRDAVGLRSMVPHASPGCIDEFYFAHATAAQRAEAFLRTKGIWK